MIISARLSQVCREKRELYNKLFIKSPFFKYIKTTFAFCIEGLLSEEKNRIF